MPIKSDLPTTTARVFGLKARSESIHDGCHQVDMSERKGAIHAIPTSALFAFEICKKTSKRALVARPPTGRIEYM